MAIATLTIDLVARLGKMEQELGRASQLAEKNAKQMDDAFAAVKGTVAGLFSGLAVGGVWQSLVVDTARAVAEIEKLSQVSSASVEDFQLMAYGARTAGVEQDKLADILKDVNDKFGEFSVTGGGELKDFFETVAKKAGVTAESFKNLSGPQALQLYYDTLQKANVSQQQATFFMEALANDATKLIPLLKDGGAGFRQMADEALRFGTVMDAKAIASAKAFELNMKRLDASMQGFKLTIGNSVIPSLNALSEEFVIGMRNSNGFWDALIKYGLTNPFKDKVQTLKELNDEATKLEDKDSIGRASEDEKKRLKDLQQRLQYYKDLEESEARMKSYQKAIAAIGNDKNEGITPDPKPGKTTKVKAAKIDRFDPLGDLMQDLEARLKPAEDAIKRFRDIQLEAAVSGAELTTSQRAFYDLVNSPEWAAMSEPWQDLIRAESELASVAETAAAHQDRLNALLGATDSARLEKVRADMQLLADALEAGKISAEQFDEAASKALGNVADKGKDDFAQLLDAIEGWGRDASKTIASTVFEGEMSLKSFGKILDQIAQQILVMIVQKQVMDPLMKSIGGAIGGAAGGAAGGAKTGGASSPTLFDGLLAMGGKFIGSFDVGTPYVPATGLALIHKGERIVTAKDNAAGNFGAGNVTNHFTIAGNVDRRTQQQISAAAGAGVQRALARNR